MTRPLLPHLNPDSFSTRVFTGFVLVLGFAGLLLLHSMERLGNYPLFVISLLICACAYWELRQCVKLRISEIDAGLNGIAVILVAAVVLIMLNQEPLSVFLQCGVGALFATLFGGLRNGSNERELGIFYLGGFGPSLALFGAGGVSLMLLAFHASIVEILFLVALVVLTDVSAYLVGKPLGKRKIAPALSPKKSLEGCIGGLLFSTILCSVGAYALFGSMSGVLFGTFVITSFCSQVADFSFSLSKRIVGMKDFGSLFPGHGGVLDRFDSLFGAAIPFLIAMQLGMLW